MIAKNYIRFPEALRFQVEMFSNGYKNSPRIMRLMTVIFKQVASVPAWVKSAAAAAKRLVKMWKGQQITLNFKAEKTNTSQAKLDRAAFEGFYPSCRWVPDMQVEHDDETGTDTIQFAGRYISFCKSHQGGHQGHAGSKHRKNRYPG